MSKFKEQKTRNEKCELRSTKRKIENGVARNMIYEKHF